MKVLFQNREDALDSWGGDTTQMIETKNHLEKLGVDVELGLEDTPNLNNYDIVHIFNTQFSEYGLRQVLNAQKYGVPVALSTIYWDLKYALDKERYLYSQLSSVRKAAGINKNIPYIAEKILGFLNRKENLIEAMLKESDILLPNSYAELEIIAQSFKMPQVRGKSLVVPNGVSIPNFNQFDQSKLNDIPVSEDYVLEVGFLKFAKGQLNLIKALFDHPEIPLIFVGAGLEDFYRKKCVELGEKRGNTYFLGKIPHKNIYPYYYNAKVHALPSFRESPGLATLEAGLFETNCVVSMHGPISEYFGFDVFCCDPSNISSIKNAVLDAWEKPKNNKLKKRIIKNFTWEKAARKTLEAYQHILQ